MYSQALDSAKVAFIEAAIEHGVLLFGNFTLKSGRQSPYFFNAGLLYSSSLLSTTAQAYAKILSSSRIPDFDVLFGPAYKGISLAAVSAVSLYQQTGKDIGYCYNRKEKKDHGEGGTMVGAPLKGRIVIIDDVLTSGKAIREAIDILKASPEAKLVGIVQLVDRQEKGQSGSGKSTVQEVEEEFGVPVEPIIGLDDIVKYLESSGKWEKELQEVRKYREEYGVQRS
ncbi:orotate phosphoribosyltransferase [Cryptococcus tetragattii IND107]|uniref:orotate phosphoribosyltransferase n=1 Tax=Cryptococcus tetragattii IND107 TaxID=1296105 RepID=A0ABR3BPF9_9TREE|nr:orotate phosphoribosyltransferase [Cryptococcus tetragattii IND107]